jgi:prepilin-type N-terminal cleavage/methylation domain-containing protein
VARLSRIRWPFASGAILPRDTNIYMRFPFLPRRGRQRGFSLIEVLVALVVLGVALLMGLPLVLQNPRIVKRTDGERQAYRALESTLEAVRAGVIPLASARLDDFVTAVGTPAPKDLTVSMHVAPTSLPDLYLVTLRATYTVFQEKHEKRLQSLVWRPPQDAG